MMLGNEEHVVLVNAECEDLIDGDGRIVTLEKRTAHKYHGAGLWSTTCCTHPISYDIPAATAMEKHS